MKHKWLLIIVACFAFGISLLAHLPARLVIPERTGEVQLLGIGGSLWRGEIRQVLYSGKPLPVQALNWQVKPTALLTARLEAEIHERQTPANRGTIGLGLLSRQLELDSVHWQFSGGSLDPWFQSWIGLQGQFVVDLQALRFPPNRSWPNRLDGRVEWQNAVLRINAETWQIGSPVMQFSGDSGAIEGVLTNSQPLVPGDGSVECAATSCRVDLDLRPTSEAPQSLLNGLSLLGLQETADGYSGQMTFPLSYR